MCIVRDESGKGKIPYRPTPYLVFTDRIPHFREKTETGKKSVKFGEIGIEIGWGLFLTEFADPVFNPVFPVCFPELAVAHPAPMPQAPLHPTAQGPEATRVALQSPNPSKLPSPLPPPRQAGSRRTPSRHQAKASILPLPGPGHTASIPSAVRPCRSAGELQPAPAPLPPVRPPRGAGAPPSRAAARPRRRTAARPGAPPSRRSSRTSTAGWQHPSSRVQAHSSAKRQIIRRRALDL